MPRRSGIYFGKTLTFQKHLRIILWNIRVWRSLVSRLGRVQEAVGSNPVTRTKKDACMFASVLFAYPRLVSNPRPLAGGLAAIKSAGAGNRTQVRLSRGFESRHSDQKEYLRSCKYSFCRFTNKPTASCRRLSRHSIRRGGKLGSYETEGLSQKSLRIRLEFLYNRCVSTAQSLSQLCCQLPLHKGA